jgi:hypothetical protein
MSRESVFTFMKERLQLQMAQSELQDIQSSAAGKYFPLTWLPWKTEKSICASPDRWLSGKNQSGRYPE